MSETRFAGDQAADLLDVDAEFQAIIEHITQAAQPITEDYRHQPIEHSYDWPGILDAIDETLGINTNELYLVRFWSVRKPDADSELLRLLDGQAYADALASGQLLHYSDGSVDENGVAVSWCVWRDKATAREALAGSAHDQAKQRVHEFYEDFYIEEYDLHRLDGNLRLRFDLLESVHP